MAEQRELSPEARLRFALEEAQPAECPDDFALLIAAAMCCGREPRLAIWNRIDAISKDRLGKTLPPEQIEENSRPYERILVHWATGVDMPAPATRRAIVAALRTHVFGKKDC